MKTAVKNTLMILILMLGCTSITHGQNALCLSHKENLSVIEPYDIEVTFDKTTHLLFPSGIRYVDLGSTNLVASKAEDAGNVLRVKASVRDFEEETNFSVITEDGSFYSFNVSYNSCPRVTNYSLTKTVMSDRGWSSKPILFKELGTNSPNMVDELMEEIYKQDKHFIKQIGTRKFGIEFLLKGIYINDDKFYFHTQIKNSSFVSFPIDFVNFKVVDKKKAKRTVVQEVTKNPIRVYSAIDEVEGKTVSRNVFVLDQFTIADDKVLRIELHEKNGSRLQVLEIKNSHLLKSKLVKKPHTEEDLQ
ncbi:conjugative transposon protein TraN [Flavobacterium cellulosilyticum]|uniref:Conjugative transposon protein TraN n=2 Tax=Flavobacterium cellulosilyticum TaxID=2541731 RepID=A0A4R5CCV7_9FLAO|nr:conjugative transposon protein TraN [Flavobacterium cellulosilyticum]TDD97841.1 conjugative transposon protein TraN [Flavobacterium cellulosilyticum]